MEKWLSIIVPVYNAEQYLSACIDSLINQNFPLNDYEIILYDDGSSDSSLRIMRKYSAQYTNIRVFTHSNEGVSQTRNCAINEAMGRYIWFVDSDDLIMDNVLSLLYMEIKTGNLDVLLFNFRSFRDSREIISTKLNEVKRGPIYSGKDFYMKTSYMTFPFNRLIRRDFLNNYRLRFIPNIYAEDHELNIRCYYHAERVRHVSIQAYWYRVREDSLSHAQSNMQKMVDSMLVIIEKRLEYLKRFPQPLFNSFVLVHDIRRLHYFLIISHMKFSEINLALLEEKNILKRNLSYLPFNLSLNWCILKTASICPQLIYFLQLVLRKLK